MIVLPDSSSPKSPHRRSIPISIALSIIFLFGILLTFLAFYRYSTSIDPSHSCSLHNGVLLPIGHFVGNPGGNLICVTHKIEMHLTFQNHSTFGALTIALFGTLAPHSTLNFLHLSLCDLIETAPHLCYNGDHFHRLIPYFVVQGGSRSTGKSIYGAAFKEQFTNWRHSLLSHQSKGVVAWAEYPIGSQFYIVLNTPGPTYLDNNHVVFGYVIEGQELLDQFNRIHVHNKDIPTDRIYINNSRRIPL